MKFSILIITTIANGLLISCTTTQKIGSLYNSTNTIENKKPTLSTSTSEFTIPRNEFSNAFAITISSKKNPDALNSLDIDSYEIQFELKSNTDLSNYKKAQIYCPILHSSNIQKSESWIITKSSKLIFSIHANELGKNLILSTLTTPSGLQGVIIFDDDIPFRFSGNLIEKESLSCEVFEARNIFRRCIIIQSKVEYPLKITVSGKNGCRYFTKIITKKIKPWKKRRFKISGDRKSQIDYSNLDFAKYFIYNSKIHFKQ